MIYLHLLQIFCRYLRILQIYLRLLQIFGRYLRLLQIFATSTTSATSATSSFYRYPKKLSKAICKDLSIMSLIRNEERGAQIMSEITVLLMMRINGFFLVLTPWCHSLGHAQRQPLGCYNRWQGSFSHHNWPSMGKGKTELPKASGEMLKTTKVQHTIL